MTDHEYEEKIKRMKELKERLERENSLGSTAPEQIEANKYAIQRIERALKRPKPVDQPSIVLNPIIEKLKNPDFELNPNALLRSNP